MWLGAKRFNPGIVARTHDLAPRGNGSSIMRVFRWRDTTS
jgi:hypothetical protein